jgi:ubiquitin carboxyl-terminal hydrolase 14
MGSAEEKAAIDLTQIQKKKFVEEMTNEEKAKIFKEITGEAMPAGLNNLGNTCYMNSSLQCLRRVNEFKEAVLGYKKTRGADPQEQLMVELKNVFRALESKGDAVTPDRFVAVSLIPRRR